MKNQSPNKTVLMIGTNPAAKGGISSVIRMYEDTGLFRSRAHFLASYKGGGPLKNILLFPLFLLRYLRTLLTQPSIRLVHVHIASYGS
jgi:hypothetical protein